VRLVGYLKEKKIMIIRPGAKKPNYATAYENMNSFICGNKMPT
jgi:hypothetical protein